MSTGWEAAGLSRKGDDNSGNGDAVYMDREAGLFGVADGVGAPEHAEIASGMVTAFFEAGGMGDDFSAPDAEILEGMGAAFDEINARLRARAGEEHRELYSTLTLALLRPGSICLAHAGDSRAYLVRDGSAERLTEDHTLVGELVKKQVISEAMAQDHPQRSFLNSCLGLHETCRVQRLSAPPLGPGHGLVLATDGLCDYLTDDEVAACASLPGPAEEIAKALADKAGERGSGDDKSCVVIRAA